MTAFVVLSSTEVVECSPMDMNLDDLKSLYDQSRADDSEWIKGKTCYGDDYGFIVNDVTRKRNPEITLKDLATAKKDCKEACDKNLSGIGYLDYVNETCKYASLGFWPEAQICYLATSEDCNELYDNLDFYFYTKQ